MKGKRLLAVLLAAIMTSSSVGITTFAENTTENVYEPQTTEENTVVALQSENNVIINDRITYEYDEHDSAWVQVTTTGWELKDRPAYSIKFELYHDNTLIASTVRNDGRLSNTESITAKFIFTYPVKDNDNPNWITTIEEANLNATNIPNKVIVYDNDNVVASKTFTLTEPGTLHWADVSKYAKYNNSYFLDLKAAMDKALNDNVTDATFELFGKNEFDGTGDVLANYPIDTINFVGKTDNAEISLTQNVSICGRNSQKKVTFKDLTLSHPDNKFANDYGQATNFFTCWTDATYTNCTFPNGSSNNWFGNTVYENCKFTNSSEDTKYNLWMYTDDGVTVTVDGCTFEGRSGIKAFSEGKSGTKGCNYITIKNNTFKTTKKAAIVVNDSALVIVDGGNNDISNVTSDSKNLVWVDEGFDTFNNNVIVQNADGKIKNNTLCHEGDNNTAGSSINYDAVASVNGAEYPSIESAIFWAKDGDTVTLLKDVVLDDVVKIEKDITLDFNNKKITTSKAFTTAFRIHGDVTVKNGDMDTTTGENYCFLVGYWNDEHVNPAASGTEGKLVIENGTYRADTTVAQASYGKIVIKDGNYSIVPYVENGVEYWQYLLNCKDNAYKADLASIEVMGGSFDNYDPNNNAAETAGTSFIADGYAVTKDENGKYVVISDENVSASVVTSAGEYVYATFAEAIANAKDGETVKLLKDANGDGIVIESDTFAEQGITIDLNGFTYTVDGDLVGSGNSKSNGFQFLKANKITIKNGTLTSSADVKASILVQNYSDLTLKSVTLDGSKLSDEIPGFPYTLSNNNGNVYINKSTITAVKGYAFDVCRFSPTSYPFVTVTVSEDSEIDGYVQISGNGETEDTTTATLKIGNNVYTDNTDYTKVSDEFVTTATRSIEVSTDKNSYEMDDEVTVTVTLNGNDIENVRFNLSYDPTKFKYVSGAENAVVNDTENGVIKYLDYKTTKDDTFVNGTTWEFKFKTIGQIEDNVDTAFTISDTTAYTGAESYGKINPVTYNNGAANVKIKLKEYEKAIFVNNEPTTENAMDVFYTGDNYTFTAVAYEGENIADENTVVTYKVNGEAVDTVSLCAKGEYVITYTFSSKKGWKSYEGTFTLTIGDPEYFVEVNLTTDDGADYVKGKKLVLVYTNTDNVAFNYDNKAMIDVTAFGYEYVGDETQDTKFNHVYAFVTDNIDDGVLNNYKANITCDILDEASGEAFERAMDVNCDDFITQKDITVVYGIYNVRSNWFTADVEAQKKLLRADTDGNKWVNGDDTNAVVDAVKNEIKK